MADEQLIKPRELPPAVEVYENDAIMTDNGATVSKATPVQIVNAGSPVASEVEAIAGTDNNKRMTPLRVRQVLDDTMAPSVLRAEAWAESATTPDPANPSSKSAKSWAELSEAAAEASNKAPDSWADFQSAPFVDMKDGSVVAFNGVQFVRDSSANIAGLGAGGGWRPFGNVDVRHFGTLTDGDDSASDVNSGIITNAWSYIRQNGGAIKYPRGTYYVSDHDGDGFALLHDFSDVSHIGDGTELKNTDPYKTLIRLGPASMTGQSNGMIHTQKNTFEGITFDQGLDLQKVKNPGGEYGNADGWAGVGGGVITSHVDALGRRLRLSFPAGGDSGASYAMQTVTGQSYYVSIQLMQTAPSNTYICASTTPALSGAITTPFNLSTITDPLLRYSFEFTATGPVTYFLLRQSSSGVTGTLDFKHAYCWPKYTEAEFGAQCVSASGMAYTTFRDCVFRNSGHYLIGLQNGGHVGNTFINCDFIDNLMDGLDCKNNGSIQRGNVITSCRFIRNSLKSDVGGGKSASLDLSEGWSVSDIYFESIGCNEGYGAALRFKTGEINDGSGRGEGGRRNLASNIRIEVVGVPYADSVGFDAMNRLNTVQGIVIRGSYLGLQIRGQGTHISGAEILDVVNGIHFLNKSAGSTSPADVGRDSSVHGATVKATNKGVIFAVTNASLFGVSVDSNNIGLEITAGNLSWYGGKLEAPTKFSGSGGTHHLVDVYGWNSGTQRFASAHSVASAGVFDVVLTHSLPFTPNINSLVAGFTNTDAVCQATVASVTSSTITVRLRVITAGTGNVNVFAQYLDQRQ